MPKELVLDADLPGSLRSELEARGFRAEHLRRLGLDGIDDDVMLKRLRTDYDPIDCVLVTSDDRMPQNHYATLVQVGFAGSPR